MARPAQTVSETGVRLDKWLWAARFYKTRSLAQTAIEAGHIRVNAQRPKASRVVQVGDCIQIRLNSFEYVLTVQNVSAQRGNAACAQTLYVETADSLAAREARKLELHAQHLAGQPVTHGRPTKKDRRQLDRFRNREF